MAEPSPPPVPPAGAALLEHLLAALTRDVSGALGAALAVPGELAGGAVVLAAVGTVTGAVVQLAGALREGRPSTADGVVAVAGGGEEPVAVALVLDRPAGPEDVAGAGAALPALAAAVALLRGWAAETARADQMVQMAQYRGVIEQAKGLVMAVTGSDAEAAFATLARASQHFNVRLRNLAVALVELVGGSPAEGPDDPAAVVVPGERDRRAAVRMWAALSAGGPAVPGRGDG